MVVNIELKHLWTVPGCSTDSDVRSLTLVNEG